MAGKAKRPAGRPGKGKTAAKPTKPASAPKPAAKAPKAEPPAPAGPPQAADSVDPMRKMSPAERKAAMEKLIEEEDLPLRSVPRPSPPPEFVRRASAAERKAAVEALARQEGGLWAGKVPLPSWKKPREAKPATEPRPAAEPLLPLPNPKPAAQPAAKPATAAAPPTTGAKPAAPAAARPKRVVLLDTNALMMQFQFHVDIEGEVRRLLDFAYEIVVPDAVVRELDELIRVTSGKDQQEARMALELSKHFKIMETGGEGDTGILRLAEKLNAIVVTNDKLLRARLRAKDIPNIHLRSRAFLTLEGHVTGV